MKKVIKLKEKDLYNIVEEVINPNIEIDSEEEIKEQSPAPKPRYVMAQEKVDKFGNRVLVDPASNIVLSVFVEG